MGVLTELRRRFVRHDDDEEDDGTIRAGVERKLHSRRPPNTAFRQQRLKSWQPVFNSLMIRLGMVVLGLVFIGVGVALVIVWHSVKSIEIDYSKCSEKAPSEFEKMSSGSYSGVVGDCEWRFSDGECQLRFESDLHGKVYLYYKLTNFYQNHRKYVDSFDWGQLRGEAVPLSDISSKCGSLTKTHEGKLIYPCGLIANSMFNDTFSGDWDSSDIAWSGDLDTYGVSQYAPADVSPPPNWLERYPEGYTQDTLEAVGRDQHLMVWMKTAALPKFVKLWGSRSEFTGNKTLSVGDNFPVSGFGGGKSLLFTTGESGGSLGLGVAFLVAGGVLTIFGVVFTLL